MTTARCHKDLQALSGVFKRAALASGNLNDALTLLRLYARLHWDNISGHFADEELEVAIHARWKDSLPETGQPALPKVDFLHVATQTHAQGGHSRLLFRLSQGLADYGTQALLLTDLRKGVYMGGFRGPVTRLQAPPAERAAAIVSSAQGAATLLLHIHPDDSAAAFAARILRGKGKKVIFVNHADHVFNLGMGAADVALEICVTGWKTTRDYRAARAQSFMGIPIVDGALPASPQVPARTGPIVSMGGPGKYAPSQGLSFPNFLMHLLPRVPNEVILIGPSGKEAWWDELRKTYPGRVHLRGMLSSGEVEEILGTASCYVDSFPLDGGTAYPQAATMGLPCFGPNKSDAPGVAPTDALRFETVAALEEALVAYLQGGAYPLKLDAARERIGRDFSSAAVTKRARAAISGNHLAPLGYLVPLGRRDSLYNARRWVEGGRVAVPKRLWRDLSWRARLDVYRRLSQTALPWDMRGKIIRELGLRWF